VVVVAHLHFLASKSCLPIFTVLWAIHMTTTVGPPELCNNRLLQLTFDGSDLKGFAFEGSYRVVVVDSLLCCQDDAGASDGLAVGGTLVYDGTRSVIALALLLLLNVI
jgi:hypothetical protein